mgnify:CR=1 FL=1
MGVNITQLHKMPLKKGLHNHLTQSALLRADTRLTEVSMNKIELEKVGHYFDTPHGRVSLFDDLSLTLTSQNTHAIIGPSGVGKSSLLSLAAGLETPKAGEIKFTCDDQQISIVELRKRSGFIFQQFHLIPNLTVSENISLPIDINKIPYIIVVKIK